MCQCDDGIHHKYHESSPVHRYGLQHGAAFGLSHGLDQLAAFRPPPKDDRVAGLYFVGASTRPGNGVPLVMIGAGLTVGRVMRDLRRGGA